jgi:hypothetical protein
MRVKVASIKRRLAQQYAQAAQSGTSVLPSPPLVLYAPTASTAAQARAYAMIVLKAILDSVTVHALCSVDRAHSARRVLEIALRALWVGISPLRAGTSASHVPPGSMPAQKTLMTRQTALLAKVASIKKLRGKASARAAVRVRSAVLATMRA